MVRREIAPTSQALQVAISRLFREPMLSESTSFGSRWGIYEMSSSQKGEHVAVGLRRHGNQRIHGLIDTCVRRDTNSSRRRQSAYQAPPPICGDLPRKDLFYELRHGTVL